MDRHMRGARCTISVWCVCLGCPLVIALGSIWLLFVGFRGPINSEEFSRHPPSTIVARATDDVRSASAPRSAAENLSAFRHVAKTYPYSIVPGGIESVQQLRNAVALDPLVAAHYAGFNLAKARMIRLGRDRTAYVSYRRGNKAYWTSRKMSLNAGEVLVTDGRNTARARCGNLVSDVPESPVSLGEPTPSILDTPLTLDAALTPGDSTDPAEVARFVPTQSMDSADPGRDVVVPLIPLFFLPASGPSAGLPSDPPPAPPTPPVSVPEPSTLLLLSTGLGAWVIQKVIARRTP